MVGSQLQQVVAEGSTLLSAGIHPIDLIAEAFSFGWFGAPFVARDRIT